MIKIAFNPSAFSSLSDRGALTHSDNPQLIDVLGGFIDQFLIIASGLAIIALFIGAGQYFLSGGDPQRAEAGKNTIMWTIVGMVLLILFYVILEFILKNNAATGTGTMFQGDIIPE